MFRLTRTPGQPSSSTLLEHSDRRAAR